MQVRGSLVRSLVAKLLPNTPVTERQSDNRTDFAADVFLRTSTCGTL
jgi:hypothetical protein